MRVVLILWGLNSSDVECLVEREVRAPKEERRGRSVALLSEMYPLLSGRGC